MPLTDIETAKETGLVQINVIAKPLILCQIVAIDGDALYLTTTPELGGATRLYGSNTYQARLESNVIDQIQAMSPQGYDIPGSINLQIADGDFAIWKNHANAHGWRGGALTVLFVLWDAPSGSYTTNAYRWSFILDKPSIGGDGILRVSAQARQSMTRLTLPSTPRQNRCSHEFPTTAAQRLDGLINPTSLYWGCGYSPDQTGGIGNQTTPNLTNPDGSPLTDSAGNYVVCDYSRSCGPGKGTPTQGCMARLGNYAGTLAPDGDIEHDTSGRDTDRFDGDTWVAPVGFNGRQYTNPGAGRIYGYNAPNPPTGQTYYNHGYGTQWVPATVLEPASDPNSYRAECIVCVAPHGPATIHKVLVNGVEVPLNNSDVIFTYYDGSGGNGGSLGGRNGKVERGAIYDGQGDPHGGLCYIIAVVPAELQASGSIADVQVLVTFPQHLHAMPIDTVTSTGGANGTVISFPAGVTNLDCAGNPPFAVYIRGNSLLPDGVYNLHDWTSPPNTLTLSGTFAAGSGSGGSIFYFPLGIADAAMFDSNGSPAANPVWALMDLLAMWGPFTLDDFDVATWYAAAQICAEQISYTDINGNTATHARYRCSFALTSSNRQSLANVVVGLRNCAGIILGRNPVNGKLQCFIEQTLADQQSAPIPGSNYSIPVNSMHADGTFGTGYLAYLFDGAGSIEKGTFKLDGRTINDTPNTISFPFQDSANAWVQDSLTLPNPGGFLTSGNQRVEAPFKMLGIENFDQGARRVNVELAKALYGNSRSDPGGTELPRFRTTVKAAHLASRIGLICGIKYDQLGL